MKRLTLDETWDYCLRMWRWIADQERKGIAQGVSSLKREWLSLHGFKTEYEGGLIEDCFFCDYRDQLERRIKTYPEAGCARCPGVKVDPEFDCRVPPSFDDDPIGFYNLLRRLNRKRLLRKK